ncbi:hypothetical protein WR25_00879 [Diploscapter pachys]|uniref:Uncharacterized protein n=1 Tax=Diploscapter pachys TaxID=2018661 RepID=A0A2A2KW15_9BILA|nr:hypothetical protein WR25_00879 [Diploscapter pachys]
MISSTFLPLPRSLSQPLPLSLLIAISLQWIIQLVSRLWQSVCQCNFLCKMQNQKPFAGFRRKPSGLRHEKGNAQIGRQNSVAELDGIKRIQRLSVSGHIAAYVVESALTDGQYELLNQHNGNPLVLYSTLSSSPSWTHVDFLASSIRISHAFNIIHEDVRSPLLILTVCDYGEST